MLLEGLQIGHYRLLRRIGGGGMGDVYLAENMHIHKQVAIKVIRPNISTNPDAVRLFLREAKAIATLDHPHILPLFDYGEASTDEGVRPYIVMPLRSEGSLEQWMKQEENRRKLSLQNVVRIVDQAADALQHAHDRQIIHLDVKPSNFLIRNTTGGAPDLLLTDFGLAKVMTTEVSVSQTSRGTPTYMAPEQWRGQPTPLSDEYALAIMTYELLTGQPPFRGNLEHLMYQHLETQPLPPSMLNPSLSRDIDIVILHALAKGPENRFASVAAFARAFRQAAHVEEPPKLPPTNILRTTLVISQEEALAGTDRVVSLSGMQPVRVHIPAGIRDGQTIPLAIQSQPAYGSKIDTILVAISIASQPERLTPPLSSPRPGKRTLLLIGLALLLILTSAGLFSFARNNQIATDNANTTATARTNITATGRAIANAETATSQAFAAATATTLAGTAIAATALAQARVATATAIQNLYTQSTSGTPTLNDPLVDNSQGHQWNEITTLSQGGTCSFKGNAYHAYQSQSNMFYRCEATKTNFSNFAYQVQATILQGDEGGIVFRFDNALRTFYAFHISINGDYNLDIDNANGFISSLGSGTSSAIKKGLNQPNLITIVAKGHNLSLYVNKQYVTSASDSTYSQGEIGVYAQDDSNPTDVAFTNAQVWPL